MKKFFRYLAAALLAGTGFAAASCSDDEPTPIPPQFPTPIKETAILPGDVYSFEIKPNMEWKISIPEDARQWFYLLDDKGEDKQTKVSTLHGVAAVADQPITIKVGAEDVKPFDEEPTVEVSMTMGNETKTIASFVIRQEARDLKFYPVKTDETGEYAYNEDTSLPFQYSYETEAKKEGAVKLEKHGAFYSARLLVESNTSWTLSVPEWVDVRVNGEAATTGAAGKSEVELRANGIKMPLDGATDVACQFVAKKSDDSVVELAKITVSLDNLTDVLECDLPKEALFSPRGSYLPNATTFGASLTSFITAPNGAQIIALPKVSYGGYDDQIVNGQTWVKVKIDEWSGEEKIQTRGVSIIVDPQGHGNTNGWERQADIFVLPATLAETVTKIEDMIADEYWSDVREEYKQYLVTTITQEESTGYLSAMNSKAMEAGKAKLEYDQWGMFDETLAQYCPWMASHEDYGFFYRLTYGDPYSSDGATLEINDNVNWAPEGGYASYEIFPYNATVVGDKLSKDNKWIQLKENRNETNVVESINVQMNFDEEYTSTYGDGKKYAVIVFFDNQNRPCITLECTYDDGAGSGGDTGAVSFANEQYAMWDGSTLEPLAAGDADYDKYHAEYAAFDPSIYRVTFTKTNPTLTAFTGLPDYGQWNEVIDGSEWLDSAAPGGETGVTLSIKEGKGVNGAKGAYIFYSGGTGFDETGKVVDPQGPAVILVVNLDLSQQQ